MMGLHMHDTNDGALINIAAGLEMGIHDIDCSVGGIGGCPFGKLTIAHKCA